MIFYNISYTIALYSLLLFYLGAQDLLAPFKPMVKFITVKAVVFMTFWQGFAISVLVVMDWIESSEDGKAVQNFLICIEMVVGAFGTYYAFSNKEYRTPPGLTCQTRNLPSGVSNSITHAISMHDVAHDVVHQFAPAYHDYVLYSDGTTGAPRKVHRARTFVILGKEMGLMRLNGKRGRVGSSPLSGEEVGRIEPPDMEQMDPRDPLTDYPRGRSLAEGDGPDEVELDEERRSPSRPADLSGSSKGYSRSNSLSSQAALTDVFQSRYQEASDASGNYGAPPTTTAALGQAVGSHASVEGNHSVDETGMEDVVLIEGDEENEEESEADEAEVLVEI
eukprot:CAMPEP_0198217900 /NCGR_PEP_ID=MMETSP1445-20131203/66357_1 /TAXON_ID=36898 /ORGANISM="Pyramimonas sp., Strain CCMP2087" /LENGTH=334 /DNA_ID=CAMNT_0043894747 /DNA_START=473 /DNA_END=1477 /DNA_ORIENTATION=+